MFDRCCGDRITVNYEIVHNPQPIPLSEAIETKLLEQ